MQRFYYGQQEENAKDWKKHFFRIRIEREGNPRNILKCSWDFKTTEKTHLVMDLDENPTDEDSPERLAEDVVQI